MAKNPHAKLLEAYLDEICDKPARSRVVPWSEWVRTAVGVPLAVGVSMALAGCGGESFGSESAGEGDCVGDQCAEQCSDGLDNDGDGTVDCDDPDCASAWTCLSTGGTGGSGGAATGGSAGAGTGGVATGGTGGVATGGASGAGTGGIGGGMLYAAPMEYECADGLDNDLDGAVDCDDTDCWDDLACQGQPEYGVPLQELDCGDGIDNDYDGQIDCLDSDCYSDIQCAALPYGIPYEDCSNGVDDDYDGLVDCDDEDCYPICYGQADYAAPMEYDCSNGEDDDYDGQTDCLDPDCANAPNCGGAVPMYAMPF